MTSTSKRAVIAGAAIVSMAAALVLTGGPSRAQAPQQEGINNYTGEVVVRGEVIGRDPDMNVRSNLLKDAHNKDVGGN